MNPWTAVALVMPREASHNLRSQVTVLFRVRAFVPPLPGVEPAARDAVAAAERGERAPVAEGRDEGEALGFRAEQNRMAFFKRSCSSCSSAYFRSSACSWAISRAGPAGGAFGARPRNRPSFASFRHFESMKG